MTQLRYKNQQYEESLAKENIKYSVSQKNPPPKGPDIFSQTVENL